MPKASPCARRGDKFCASGELLALSFGGSAKKPFCDGTHTKLGFDRTETASRKPYLEDLVEDRYGPLGVRGGVSVISADDFPYEIGNRVTLCWRRVTKQALLRRLARRDQVQGRSLAFGGVIVPERRPAAGVSRSRP